VGVKLDDDSAAEHENWVCDIAYIRFMEILVVGIAAAAAVVLEQSRSHTRKVCVSFHRCRDFALRNPSAPPAAPIEGYVLPLRKETLAKESGQSRLREKALSQAEIDGWSMRVSGITTGGGI